MPKAKLKSKTTSNRPAQRRLRVQRLVRQIADRLFTVSYGTKDADKGTRLAVMKGKMPHEIHLGGWCRSAAEREIEAVLSNSQAQRLAANNPDV